MYGKRCRGIPVGFGITTATLVTASPQKETESDEERDNGHDDTDSNHSNKWLLKNLKKNSPISYHHSYRHGGVGCDGLNVHILEGRTIHQFIVIVNPLSQVFW